MADMKQILVVDDAAEMLEFLRSMLAVSNSDHQVVGVPSAEEAEFELRLTKFDLLITDVRLPGKSGFDLVRRAKRIRPEMPVIMITAYLTEQGEQEAKELEIYRYFRKPLETDSMITAVQHALYGEPEPPPPMEAPLIAKVNVELTDAIEIQLDGLRNDTSAFGLLLVAGGHVVYESGGHRELHPDRIAAIVNQKMAHSTLLAEELGEGDSTFNFLYQAGARYELYSVNIGRDYFVTLLFNVSEWRGRIGQVWLSLQRAVRELEKSLPPLDLAQAITEPMPQETKAAISPPDQIKPEPAPPPPIVQAEPQPVLVPEPTPEPIPEPIQLSEAEMVEFAGLFDGMETADAAVDFDAFWDSAFDSDDGGSTKGELSLAEAQKMGLVSLSDMPAPSEPATPEDTVTAVSEPEPTLEPDYIEASTGELKELFADLAGDNEGVDFDAFWDTALDEGDSGSNLRGISFEDAVKQGLLSTDFRETE